MTPVDAASHKLSCLLVPEPSATSPRSIGAVLGNAINHEETLTDIPKTAALLTESAIDVFTVANRCTTFAEKITGAVILYNSILVISLKLALFLRYQDHAPQRQARPMSPSSRGLHQPGMEKAAVLWVARDSGALMACSMHDRPGWPRRPKLEWNMKSVRN
jgi:hypothetical protein